MGNGNSSTRIVSRKDLLDPELNPDLLRYQDVTWDKNSIPIRLEINGKIAEFPAGSYNPSRTPDGEYFINWEVDGKTYSTRVKFNTFKEMNPELFETRMRSDKTDNKQRTGEDTREPPRSYEGIHWDTQATGINIPRSDKTITGLL